MSLLRRSPNYNVGVTTAPAVQWVANSTYSTTASNHTITLPTGYQANDILLLCFENSDGNLSAQGVTNLTNNGWARVANSKQYYYPSLAANVVSDIWWSRAATAAQTAVNIGDAGEHNLTVVAAIRNVINTGDPWDGTINVNITSATSQVTSYNVTTSTANAFVVTVITSPRDSAAGQINASPLIINGDDATELTERCDWGTITGAGGTIAILTHRKPTAGATGNVRANTVTACTALIWSGALKWNI